jgi:hypothetical protein
MLDRSLRTLLFAGVAAAFVASTTPLGAVAPPIAESPSVSADHSRQMAAGRELFTGKVRGILGERCFKCHGGGKTRGGLNMITRESLLKGGDSGAVFVPGNGKQSRLYRMAAHLADPAMPPAGNKKLDRTELAALLRWIDLGAPYDKPLSERPDTARPKVLFVSDQDRNFWSFRLLIRPAVPTVKINGWARNPIDRFLLEKMEAKGLMPSSEADRQTLIRRAYFDVIGLPPAPEEVSAFLDDRSPLAYERMIDRLLASPHHGERWARHWLDIARFAESHGFEHDTDRPTAYPYRDFVISALNLDLPYDTFIRWQLAGDEIAPDDPLALTATGFLGAGVHSTQITANTVEKERYDELDDIVRTTGTAMLGLTIGCARCHDHKYDPIPTRDYYRLLSTFTTTVRCEVQVAGRKAMICSEGLTPVRLHSQGADFLKETHFLKRGDPNQKDGVATQSFLQVLMRSPEGEKRWQASPPKGWRTSYRRRSLANWITDAEAGAGHLLARVIVNRLWQHYFGRGIVATASDFGLQGDRPSHPELLDWLASELIAQNWRLKPIHRFILTSAAYRQANTFDAGKYAIDPDNRLVWRRVPRRLEAEVIRDSLLTVAGQLDRRMFGPGTLDPNHKRRSIYFFVKRSQLVPMMVLFDAPDGVVGIEQRTTTTIAPQALLMMNNAAVRASASALAGRLARLSDPAAAIRTGYALALGRPPHLGELANSLAFLSEQRSSYQEEKRADAEQRALVDFCQVLLGLNEFVYID